MENIILDQPKISIITVVYNDATNLEKTILSIATQNYNNKEHIIIDGGSTDGSIDILKKYESQIAYWKSEPDNGIYDGMNKGIKAASGEWLNFLNAGDTYVNENILPTIFSNQVGDDIYLCYGDTNVYSASRKFIKQMKAKPYSWWALIFWGSRIFCHQAIFIRKEFCILYNHNLQLKGELDWYFNLYKKNNKKEVLHIHQPIVNYFLGGTGDRHYWKNQQERFEVLNRHVGLLGILISLPIIFYGLLNRFYQKVCS